MRIKIVIEKQGMIAARQRNSVTGMLAEKKCQLISIPGISDPLQPIDGLWQRRKLLKRIFKRRWNYLKKVIRGVFTFEKKVLNKFVLARSMNEMLSDS